MKLKKVGVSYGIALMIVISERNNSFLVKTIGILQGVKVSKNAISLQHLACLFRNDCLRNGRHICYDHVK